MSMGLKSNLGAIVLTALAVTAGGLWWQATRTRSQADASAHTLAECQQLAAQIRALQDAPQEAQLAQRPVEELSQQVEAWSSQAGIAAERLLRVEPHAPRRVGDTDYLEQGAKVELRDVTLLQLAQLADNVHRDESQLHLTELRLIAPRQETAAQSNQETWQVEFILSSLVYAPKTARR